MRKAGGQAIKSSNYIRHVPYAFYLSLVPRHLYSVWEARGQKIVDSIAFWHNQDHLKLGVSIDSLGSRESFVPCENKVQYRCYPHLGRRLRKGPAEATFRLQSTYLSRLRSHRPQQHGPASIGHAIVLSLFRTTHHKNLPHTRLTFSSSLDICRSRTFRPPV